MKEVTVEANGKVFIYGVEYVKKGQDIILVPENIKITQGNCSEGILFNDDKQELFVNLGTKQYEVISAPSLSRIYKLGELKLTPCKREDLKCGDLAFRTDGVTDFTNKEQYCLILDEKSHVCIENSHDVEYPASYSTGWTYWYKVEEV
jgi:hypothetical protein